MAMTREQIEAAATRAATGAQAAKQYLDIAETTYSRSPAIPLDQLFKLPFMSDADLYARCKQLDYGFTEEIRTQSLRAQNLCRSYQSEKRQKARRRLLLGAAATIGLIWLIKRG